MYRGIFELAIVKDEHPSRHNLDPPGSAESISLEIRRKRLLELKGQALAHNANAVHGVHQCFGVGLQDVAFDHFDHRSQTSLPVRIPDMARCHSREAAPRSNREFVGALKELIGFPMEEDRRNERSEFDGLIRAV